MSKKKKKDEMKTDVLLPLYLYPSSGKNLEIYKRVAKRSKTVSITVILNPNNGLDSLEPPNRDWKNVVELPFKKTLGYVHLSYMKRDRKLVMKEIQGYAQNGWNVDGIFFDEAPSNLSCLEAIHELCEYTRKTFKNDHVRIYLNPGVPVDEKFFDVVDVIVIFENFYRSHWEKFNLRSHCSTKRIASKSAVILRSVPDTNVIDILNQLEKFHIGHVFITGIDCEFHTPVKQYYFEKY